KRGNAAKGGDRGYDAAKLTKGRKRHIVVDVLGLILAVAVTGANVQDRDGGQLVLKGLKHRFPRLARVWADGVYAAPTDAAFEHIKDGIRNLAQINSPLSSFGFRCWEAPAQSAPTAPPSDRSDREAHSSHHHTSCILRQVLRLFWRPIGTSR